MSACFLPVLSEMVRLTLLNETESPELVVILSPVENQGNRARAGARFWVTVSLSWGALYSDAWANGVQLVDARGYPVVWQFADVGKWLVKALSGAPCVVTVRIEDAAQVPAKWTTARAAAAAQKVLSMDNDGIQNAAAAKVASVQGWAASTRKTSVLDAAEKMIEAADLLLDVQDIQTGAGLVVDPPPVDPPPVDPAPVGFDGAVQVVNGELSGVRFISALGDVLVWRYVHAALSTEVGFTVECMGAGSPAMGDAPNVFVHDQNGNQIGMAAYGNGVFFGAAGVTEVYLRTYGVSGYGQAFGGVALSVSLNV